MRKYIYGPGVDQPISMIEVADSNATYYYHYDALGSVIVLSDEDGDTVQTYEYSVFGEVAVEDANHTNPYMFAGRRYDAEIGLYYNRARYYNPYTGRFLQTDPIGYGDEMNMYRYCLNNPLNGTDPLGLMTSLVGYPELVAGAVAKYGVATAIEGFGEAAVGSYLIQQVGISIAVTGMVVISLDPSDPCCPQHGKLKASDPNSNCPVCSPSNNSWEKIQDDKKLFRYWFKHKHPRSRVYNENEALEILRGYNNHLGGGNMRVDPPDEKGEWDWHFHDPERNVRISITEEAFDLLRKLGF